MTELLQAWWTWLSVASLQAAILIPLVAIFDRTCGTRRWPSFQAALWTLVMLRLSTPPMLAIIVPESVLERLPSEPLPLSLAPSSSFAGPWIQMAFVVWCTGALGSAMWLCWRYRRVRALCSSGSSAPEDLMALARAAAARLRLTRVPAIVIHDALSVPATIGLRHPMIVLPKGLPLSASRRDLEHVLLHELAHVRRRDAVRAAVSVAIQIVYWFHPLVWIARARLAALREIACDREVANVAESRDEYRRTLIRLARPLAAPPATLVAGARLFARRSELLTRLELLAAPARSPSPFGRVAAVAICAAATSMVVVVDAAVTRPPISVDAESAPFAGCLRLRYAVYAALAQEAAQKGQ